MKLLLQLKYVYPFIFPINYNERIEEFEELIENVETLSASTLNDYFKLSLCI